MYIPEHDKVTWNPRAVDSEEDAYLAGIYTVRQICQSSLVLKFYRPLYHANNRL